MLLNILKRGKVIIIAEHTPSSGTSLVELQEVTKSFSAGTAVSNLSFSLEPGKILGLLGHNGAGKTTTIRMILNLIKPDTGHISVIGQPVCPTVKDKIGYLPEERGLFKSMKVIELLTFFGTMNNMKASKAKSEALWWLKKLDLLDRKDAKVDDFSKGMQQKVQWISAVLHRPPLLILDEPFSGLDPVNASVFEELINEIKESGSGILFSTHILEQAERLLDDVIMLKKGAAVVKGTLPEVRARFGSDWVQVRGEGSAEALSTMREITDLDVKSEYSRLRPADGYQARNILEELVKRDCEIREFSLVEPSLKEIFLYKIGDLEVDGVLDREVAA